MLIFEYSINEYMISIKNKTENILIDKIWKIYGILDDNFFLVFSNEGITK